MNTVPLWVVLTGTYLAGVLTVLALVGVAWFMAEAVAREAERDIKEAEGR